MEDIKGKELIKYWGKMLKAKYFYGSYFIIALYSSYYLCFHLKSAPGVDEL
jgi:hypothetical protein